MSTTLSMFDPHVHMTSRTTDDYEAMTRAGVRAVLEPAFWVGQPRTSAGTFADYFASLVGWERFRASQFGIRHCCALALNPKEANDTGLAHAVIEMLPRWLVKDGVVAVGEIGFDDQTEAEEEVFARQVDLAIRAKLPILVHTPHRDKKRGTERTLALLREHRFPSGMAVIDHNTEETVQAVLDAGCWAGHSIYPQTKMDAARMTALVKRFGSERIIVNSAADWGVSDPLSVPKTADEMLRAGIERAAVEAIVWQNPIAFFAQSGRIALGDFDRPAAVDQRAQFQGNSVLRGQTPRVGTPA